MSAIAQMGRNLTPIFREAWPRHAAKRLARALGCPIDTARNYVAGKSRLTADALLVAAARDAALLSVLEDRLHALRTAHLAADLDLAGHRGAVAGHPAAADAHGDAAPHGGGAATLVLIGGAT